MNKELAAARRLLKLQQASMQQLSNEIALMTGNNDDDILMFRTSIELIQERLQDMDREVEVYLRMYKH